MKKICFSGSAAEKKPLLSLIREKGLSFSAPCGGNGTCGKCAVRFLKGAPEPGMAEKKHFSPDDLKNGYRLACRAFVSGAFSVEWENPEDEMVTETGLKGTLFKKTSSGEEKVALDLGTTTLAAALLVDGRAVEVKTSVNHQRSFGADVISRIREAEKGNGKELRRLVKEDIKSLLFSLGCDPDTVPVYLSGNTVMQHLYQGLPVETLGRAPYKPVDLSLRTEGNTVLLPGISAFIGPDIVSGIVSLDMDQREKPALLIDLGTNGEMVIGNREKLLAASTAAGPALEGANLSSGCAGIPGAISGVTIKNQKARCRTIGDLPPIGLCGSGVIEAAYELYTEGLMDETGLFIPKYFETGFPLSEGVRITSSDIREIQLAKGAIRAGMESLIEEYGLSYDEIDTVYLSGGFGQSLNPVKASGIGLIPPELSKKTKGVSNTSLAGAIRFAAEEEVRERFLRVRELTEEITLSDHPGFQELFIRFMNF